jgi:hypothetical protein
MNCHAEVLSGFHVPELPPDAPHLCKIVAAVVRCLHLSELRESWGAWKEVYNTVCASLVEMTAQDIPLPSGISGRRRSGQSLRATATATAPSSGVLFRAIAGSTMALTTR